MSLDLRITFNGTAPGLQAHSLSLAAFARPLDRLVTALQRTATALLKDREEQPLGPIATKAKGLDLEITSLEHNCVSLSMRCVGPSDNDDRELMQRTMSKLLADIESEVNGREVSEAARRYVRALPDGMTTQTYRLSRDGVTLSEVTCGALPHVDESDDLPRLVQLRGEVAGVSFLPSISVMFKSGEKTLKLAADVVQVDNALRLRGRSALAAIYAR